MVRIPPTAMELVLPGRLFGECHNLFFGVSLVLRKRHPFANDFSAGLVVFHVRGSLAYPIWDRKDRPRGTSVTGARNARPRGASLGSKAVLVPKAIYLSACRDRELIWINCVLRPRRCFHVPKGHSHGATKPPRSIGSSVAFNRATLPCKSPKVATL
jgi:hypothetical protein